MTNGGERIERRIERAVFETDRHLVVGDVTLPPEGYQSRFSDSLNRPDIDFIPLTNVEITVAGDGKVSERPFVVLAKAHDPARLSRCSDGAPRLPRRCGAGPRGRRSRGRRGRRG